MLASKIIAFLQGRSTHWPAFRKAHIAKECAACGLATKLVLHHIIPVHILPSAELLPSNVITLCMGKYKCHFNIGHNRNWDKWNPEVVNDARLALHIRRTYGYE